MMASTGLIPVHNFGVQMSEIGRAHGGVAAYSSLLEHDAVSLVSNIEI
jgi:hypothetical protein